MRRPVHAGVGGHGVHRHVQLAVECGDAGLVVPRDAGRPTRAFRKDHQLAVVDETLLGVADHLLQCRRMAGSVHHDHVALPGVPAEERDPHQLLLGHKAAIRQPRELSEDVEHALMLGRYDGRAGRHELASPKLDADVTHHP